MMLARDLREDKQNQHEASMAALEIRKLELMLQLKSSDSPQPRPTVSTPYFDL